MQEVGRGMKVFDHEPVRGVWRTLNGPEDVLALMETPVDDVVAVIKDAGATFLTPLYHELAAVVCTSGTPRSHIGIVCREFQLPCIVSASFAAGPPADGDQVEVDCSGDDGVVRRV
jgi:phosphoenolpyruvate-protein kinase (PTS system EI component)